MLKKLCLAALGLLLSTAAAKAVEGFTGEVGPGVPAFRVRPGYKVTLAATGLAEARSIEFADDGKTLFVTQPGRGRIVCLKNPDENGKYQSSTPFVSKVPSVHGLQWYKGWLWYTQSGSVHKAKLKPDGTADEITDIDTGVLPEGGGHWYRPILVDDDGFYTAVGDDQNIGDHTKDDREKIWHYNLDGSGKKLFCSGIRNTEKLLYRPGSKDIWGCDHGSDNFGGKKDGNGGGQATTDLNPPDEFNHYIQDGFYGHPFVVGNRVPRPEYVGKEGINMNELTAKTIPPAWCNGAHWANDGWCFTTTTRMTGQIGDAIIAFHGSWNSGPKVGYCIQRIEFDPVTNLPCGTMTLVSALPAGGGNQMARPVDCAEAPDGSILFSADDTRQIYRLSKVEPAK